MKESQYRFCVITIEPGRREFGGTAQRDANGVSWPKDIWYNERWTSIGRVLKMECSDSYSVDSYSEEFLDPRDLLEQ